MSYLYHYGVPGMKWGVRHDYKPKGRQRRATSESSKRKRKGLTDIQKKRLKTAAIIGVTAVAAGLAIYGAVKYNNLKSAERAVKLGEELLRDREVLKDKIPDLRAVNRRDVTHYNDWYQTALEKANSYAPNRGHNCLMCSTAYDLRRRGIDVEASPIFGGLPVKTIHELYPGAKIQGFVKPSQYARGEVANKLMDVAGLDRLDVIQNVSDSTMKATSPLKSAFSTMSRMGDGARGSIIVQMKNVPMAHSMAFEVINGKPYILDAQSGKIYTSFDKFKKVWDDSIAMVTRFDNVEPDVKSMLFEQRIAFKK